MSGTTIAQRFAAPAAPAPPFGGSIGALDIPPAPTAADPNPFDTPGWNQVRSTVRTQAGNASSVLSMLGAGAMFVPGGEQWGRPIIVSAFLAGAVDTAVQGARWAAGRKDSNLQTTLYAATGLLPASSMLWVTYMRHSHPSMSENLRLIALVANLGLVGYEMAYRIPRMKEGREDYTGYLAIGAAVGGVIAKAR